MFNKVTITRVANGYIVTVEARHEHQTTDLGPFKFLASAPSEPQLFVARTWEDAEEIARQWLTGVDVPAAFKDE